MNNALNVKITNELKNPTEPGVHYRLLCMTGPNKGKVYYLVGKRIIIGRGENVDIQIVDTKISREHAELSFSENSYTISDLGAQNGVVVNDNKVKQKKLVDAEKIVIGQTVFKYNVFNISENAVAVSEESESGSGKKESNKSSKNKIHARASDFEDADSGFSNKNNKNKNNGNSSKKLIIGVVVLGGIYMFLDSGDSSKPAGKARNSSATSDFDKDFSAVDIKKANVEDPDIKRKLGMLIHSGRREFSEGNYFRAIEDFRLALLLSPNNGHASFYLSKAKQSLDEDIRKNMEKGKQEYESKKLQSAIVSYCGVVQLIQNYPTDERYKNAMLAISAIEAELGLEKGEVKCFEAKSTESKN